MSIRKVMSEKERALFTIFKSVVEAERSAQAMYYKAFELCDDPVLKKMLKGFHEDEIRHEREVLTRYQQYTRDCKADEA